MPDLTLKDIAERVAALEQESSAHAWVLAKLLGGDRDVPRFIGGIPQVFPTLVDAAKLLCDAWPTGEGDSDPDLRWLAVAIAEVCQALLAGEMDRARDVVLTMVATGGHEPATAGGAE
jgi:hypothetical protein